jgi:hypothetical protein
MLWSILVVHAWDFEIRMDFEHVEDILIDKRVVVVDEHYELDVLIDGSSRPVDLRPMEFSQDSMEDLLDEISRVNRHRRNYLLLRDWSKRRPWYNFHSFSCTFLTLSFDLTKLGSNFTRSSIPRTGRGSLCVSQF